MKNEQEIWDVLAASGLNVRCKAMIAVLYETGMRVAELKHLIVDDVQLHNTYVLFLLRTPFPRTLTVSKGLGYIEHWMRHHPAPELPAASFWAETDQVLSEELQVGCMTVGVDTPSSLRHIRAIQLAPHLNEKKLCEMFGWRSRPCLPLEEGADEVITARVKEFLYGLFDEFEYKSGRNNDDDL